MDIIKVSGTSHLRRGRRHRRGIREHKHADVQAIGASAINQAVKALALARDTWRMMGSTSSAFPNLSMFRSMIRYAQP